MDVPSQPDDLQFPDQAVLILGKDRSCLEELENYCDNRWKDRESIDRDIGVQHFLLSRMLNVSRGTVGSRLVFQALLKINFVLDRQSLFRLFISHVRNSAKLAWIASSATGTGKTFAQYALSILLQIARAKEFDDSCLTTVLPDTLANMSTWYPNAVPERRLCGFLWSWFEASKQHGVEVGQELQNMLNDNNLLQKLKSSDFDAHRPEDMERLLKIFDLLARELPDEVVPSFAQDLETIGGQTRFSLAFREYVEAVFQNCRLVDVSACADLLMQKMDAENAVALCKAFLQVENHPTFYSLLLHNGVMK